MNEESSAALLKAMQDGLGGVPTHEFTVQLAHHVENASKFLRPVHDTETIEAYFATMPEVSPDALAFLIALIGVVPAAVRQFMVEGAVIAKREIPSPDLGRPKALDAETEKRIIKKVGDLHLKGVALRPAMLRASKEFDVSVATVRRVWGKRGQLADAAPMTVRDFWQFMFGSSDTAQGQ